MKARIERDHLRKALRTVLPAVGKTSQPILTGVHIEAIDGDGLRFTTTDLQLTITADVDAKILKDGSIVAPARLLAGWVDRCPAGAVLLEVRKERLTATAGDASIDLQLLPVAEWPKVGPVVGDTVTFTADHIDLLRRSLPFVAVDDRRPVLRGVHLEGALAIATDSYRMALAHLDGLALPAATIPADALNVALKDASDMEVTIGDHRATFAHDAATWTTVLLEDDYPPADRMMRHESPHALTFTTDTLLEAIQRTAILDDEGICVKIQRDGDKATVWIDHIDVGRADDIISCDGDYEPPVGFNGTYLASMLTAAGTDQVTFELLDSLKPVIVHAPGLDLLTMPVRIA